MDLNRRTLLATATAVLAAPALARAQIKAGDGIVGMNARRMVAALRKRELSSREVVAAHLTQIDRLNPRFNAIVSRVDRDVLLKQAAAMDEEAAAGRFLGPLHGLPHAVKDTAPVKGVRSTQGSPILRDNIPAADSLVVERMRKAGMIFIGKTNVPEFALGSHSFNPLFGTTGNAYAPDRSAGGSTGGGAVALALRMVPLADGSDFGGSLRNPAGWNNVFGFRPSFGRVPSVPNSDMFWQNFATSGPMARTVEDLALLLSVQAGSDPRSPFSLPDDPAIFAGALDQDWKGKRIGWLGDLGGALPMEAGVLDTCVKALEAFRAIGMTVEAATLSEPAADMWRTAVTLRHWSVGSDLQAFYDDPAKRALMKPEAIWEVEGGMKLTAPQLAVASAGRTRIYQAFRTAFERYDFLVLPTAQVFPFENATRWPTEIAGVQMDSYHRWMEVTLPATMAGLPVLAVPAGFGGARHLPMGLQIIGPNHADLAVLKLGHAYEQASPWIAATPPAALNDVARG
ncbi:amidase [Caulobacter sp. 602-1]|uniref:amidase n=1 Tax=unclassified Caulobacter TaxID=2648921 RepID=UPI000F6405C3|nr:amidase [Caulobacter sp. 602-1]RRN66189.1 amidase [Caulobacter sp. 602-1]